MRTLIIKSIAISLLTFLAITSASAGWQCNARNAHDQKWIGTGGTRAAASANAIGFCAAHSTYSRNCHITRCFVR